jgi:hypothetical protein
MVNLHDMSTNAADTISPRERALKRAVADDIASSIRVKGLVDIFNTANPKVAWLSAQRAIQPQQGRTK